MADGAPDLGDRVLVLAPTARDGIASRDLLTNAGIRSHLCATIADVCREAALGAGAALVTAEAIVGDTRGLLAELLKAQPRWSDLPVIVLTPPGPDSPRLLKALEAVGSTMLMKRPVQVSTLVSTVRGALRDRRRQYEVRDLLAERERAAEGLRVERERYRVTLSSIGDAVIATDAGGAVTFLNPVAEALTGWTATEATGQPLTDVFHIVNEATRREVENPALRALANGVVVGLANHTVLIARDGTERPIDDSAAPIRENGSVGGAVLVFRDITERKRAEEALRAERERSEFVRRATGVGFWFCDLPFDELQWDEWVKEHFWLPAGARVTIGTFYDRIHPDDRERTRTAIERSVADRAGYDTVYRTVNPDTGAERWVRAIGRTFCDESGAPRRFDGVTLDITEQRRAEAALRASEGRHRVLADLAAATQPLTDPAAIMATSARLLAEHLGVDRCAYAEVEDESVYVITGDYTRGVPSIVGRWDVGAFGTEHLRMMREGEPYVVEDADTDPRIESGDLPAYRATAIRAVICVPLIKEGKFTAAMAVHQTVPRHWTPDEVRVVTTVVGRCWEALERARVERTLRESEARYRAIVEATPECVKLVASGGTLLQINRAGLAMVEGDESALGQCVYNVIAPEDRERFRAFNERVCRGERGTLEFDIIGLKGTRRHMETTAVPLPVPQGGFTQLAVTRDVTARKLTEAALREREARLQMFLGNATDYAVIISDPDDRAVEWLGGAEQITGWRSEEAIGQPLAIIFTPEDRAAGVPEAETTRAAEAGRAENTRWHQRKDGSRFFAEGVTVSIRGPAGELRGFGKVFRDATARKRAEDALKEADRKKDDFIALLAHELRNPLAPIRNGLQVLRLSRDQQTRERSQAMMDRQLAHMVRMIDDLLDVSRIGRNKMELRRAWVALEDVVNSAVETARPVIEEAGHELTVSLPPRPVFLDADLTRLSQVLSNLLTNSAKYTERGGTIRLSAESNGGGVVVSVRDNGIGIPARALPTIFDMFSQVDRPIERRTGGLGIGLALVKGLVEMHGGTVEVHSEGEGRGSTFTVTLSTVADEAEPAAESPGDGQATSGRVRRVLVVDDNHDGAESMADMLRLLGHQVHTAHDGLEAIEQAELFQPEVILMDIGMPVLNGLDATRRIREQPWGRGVAIIALTGWGQDGDRERSREAGCDGHLVKPVDLADLARALTDFAGR